MFFIYDYSCDDEDNSGEFCATGENLLEMKKNMQESMFL